MVPLRLSHTLVLMLSLYPTSPLSFLRTCPVAERLRSSSPALFFSGVRVVVGAEYSRSVWSRSWVEVSLVTVVSAALHSTLSDSFCRVLRTSRRCISHRWPAGSGRVDGSQVSSRGGGFTHRLSAARSRSSRHKLIEEKALDLTGRTPPCLLSPGRSSVSHRAARFAVIDTRFHLPFRSRFSPVGGARFLARAAIV